MAGPHFFKGGSRLKFTVSWVWFRLECGLASEEQLNIWGNRTSCTTKNLEGGWGEWSVHISGLTGYMVTGFSCSSASVSDNGTCN